MNNTLGILASPCTTLSVDNTPATTVTTGIIGGTPWYISNNNFSGPMVTTQSLVTIVGQGGKELVSISSSGIVTWQPNATIDAAAEAFGKSLVIGTEFAAKVKDGLRSKIEDEIYTSLFDHIDKHGAITYQQLTEIQQYAKIATKLAMK